MPAYVYLCLQLNYEYRYLEYVSTKVQQRIRGGSTSMVRTICHYCLDDVSVCRHSRGGGQSDCKSRPELQQAMRLLDRLS